MSSNKFYILIYDMSQLVAKKLQKEESLLE